VPSRRLHLSFSQIILLPASRDCRRDLDQSPCVVLKQPCCTRSLWRAPFRQKIWDRASCQLVSATDGRLPFGGSLSRSSTETWRDSPKLRAEAARIIGMIAGVLGSCHDRPCHSNSTQTRTISSNITGGDYFPQAHGVEKGHAYRSRLAAPPPPKRQPTNGLIICPSGVLVRGQVVELAHNYCHSTVTINRRHTTTHHWPEQMSPFFTPGQGLQPHVGNQPSHTPSVGRVVLFSGMNAPQLLSCISQGLRGLFSYDDKKSFGLRVKVSAV